MHKSWHISRRTMLRGVGVSMALPLLDAMGPTTLRAQSSARRPPVRFGAIYVANGFHPDGWKVGYDGPLNQLSPTLSPLEQVKRKVLVINGLHNEKSFPGEGHHVKTACWLTSVEPFRGDEKDLRLGVSVDQLAAQKIGMFTPLPSLELGCQGRQTGLDMGSSRIYGSHISWRNETTPLAKITSPADAFDRLFRGNRRVASGDVERDESLFAQPEAPDEKTSSDEKSVVDAVLAEAQSLKSKVGQADQRKIDEYLDAVRELEKSIERANRPAAAAAGAWRPRTQPKLARPSGNPADHAEHVKNMLDLMLVAFWTDTTRLITFMTGNAVSGTNMSFIDGVRGGHHEISHHNNEAGMVNQYKLINRWHVSQLAYLLEAMDKVDEGNGTLLDNSMILFGSGLMDGNAHNPRELPIILAGRGGGSIASGRSLSPKQSDAKMANLHVEMLARLGAPVNKFGDSTGGLPGLR